MKKLAIAAITLLAVIGTARADSVLDLNSEEASYSILSRSTRTELARLPVGRERHHLIPTPDGKEVLIGSTATNELLALDSKTGERRRVVSNIIDPYQLGFSGDGKWFVTVAYRLDHVDIFDADSKTVFVSLQQSGRLAAFDLATQTLKWNVPVGNTPAGVLMLPDDKRVLVALTGEDGVVVVDPKDGKVTGRLQTGKGAHNFWPKGDGRHWFLSNRVEGTVSMIDTQDMRVAGSIKVPGGPDCMDITADGKELWVTQRFLRRVAVVDLEQMKVVASIPVGKSPHGVYMLKSGPAAPGAPVSPAGGPLRAVSTGSGTTR